MRSPRKKDRERERERERDGLKEGEREGGLEKREEKAGREDAICTGCRRNDGFALTLITCNVRTSVLENTTCPRGEGREGNRGQG